ncbi:hypothetical protein VTJ49DRAFT_6840 [Mycothermus thermophilus]|uniref:HhH-GPD domain-containing protein n=1 Tax=Humicola insolens TaxID=85995 RepID=A0ABR3VPR3_HUMIN
MLTRSAARRLLAVKGSAESATNVPSGNATVAPVATADAVPADDDNVCANTDVDAAPTGSTSGVTPNHDTAAQVSTAADDHQPTEKTAPVRAKRKREKRQTLPIKGGWVLPHGMGVQPTSKPDVSSHQEDEPPSQTSPAPKSLTAVPASEKFRAAPRARGAKKASGSVTQARIVLRITKPRTQDDAGVSTKQATVIKAEEPEHDTVKEEEHQEGPPRKRQKVVVKTEATESKVMTSDDGMIVDSKTTKAIETKQEETKDSGEPRPKLLIIKGIKVIDSLVTKLETCDKIIVDASQILNPDYRIMVKRGKDNPYGLTPGYSPYPYRRVPTPEACEEVYRILTEMHGEVPRPETMPAASLEIAGCGEVPCVLDALLRTLISGNTLMDRADAAVRNIIQHYGLREGGTGAGSINWDKVRLSSHQELTNVIKIAGNGPKRARHIKQILDMVYEENLAARKAAEAEAAASGKTLSPPNFPNLDHVRGMTKDEAMAKLVSYPGIGIKTAACVTLFCLQMPCFAVDTHVHKFCRWLGWVPAKADPDNCFRHGDFMVPDHLKYSLHQLFIRHGKTCFKCRKATKPGTKEWKEAPDCPLEHLLDRSKDEAKSAKPNKSKRAKKGQDEEGSDMEDAGKVGVDEEEVEEGDGEEREEGSDNDDEDGEGDEEVVEDDDDNDSDWVA